MTPGENGISGRVIGFDSEEMEEGAQSCQAAVDGGDSMALVAWLRSMKASISCNSHFARAFCQPGEEQCKVVGIVDVGGGMGRFAAQPFLKTLDFW